MPIRARRTQQERYDGHVTFHHRHGDVWLGNDEGGVARLRFYEGGGISHPGWYCVVLVPEARRGQGDGYELNEAAKAWLVEHTAASVMYAVRPAEGWSRSAHQGETLPWPQFTHPDGDAGWVLRCEPLPPEGLLEETP